ncbi:MAG: NTP transferase domain-containing protein [Ignavibacteriaceae bacterium]|nr:NTP transferase domain-containing protein [Ignavibacteriaceae bacterium]
METNPKSKVRQNITGLLLCAGMSGRMGTSKALMMYEDFPFAVQIIKKMFLVSAKVVVVVGHEPEKVKSEIIKYFTSNDITNLKFVLNKNYKSGMFSSLQYGLKNIQQSEWILYHFVDQPSLPNSFYKEFAEQLSEGINWLQPSHKKKLGHPILFDNHTANMILQLSENNSLRDLSNDQRIKKQIWNCNYPQILEDIDTIEQFNSLTIKQFVI